MERRISDTQKSKQHRESELAVLKTWVDALNSPHSHSDRTSSYEQEGGSIRHLCMPCAASILGDDEHTRYSTHPGYAGSVLYLEAHARSTRDWGSASSLADPRASGLRVRLADYEKTRVPESTAGETEKKRSNASSAVV